MCLHTIESTEHKPHAEGKGWKIFEIGGSEVLYTWLFGDREPLALNKWLKSKDNGSVHYPLGFHVFTTRSAAVLFKNGTPGEVIRRVKWRDQVAIGTQNENYPGKVFVAKEMMIL